MNEDKQIVFSKKVSQNSSYNLRSNLIANLWRTCRDLKNNFETDSQDKIKHLLHFSTFTIQKLNMRMKNSKLFYANVGVRHHQLINLVLKLKHPLNLAEHA